MLQFEIKRESRRLVALLDLYGSDRSSSHEKSAESVPGRSPVDGACDVRRWYPDLSESNRSWVTREIFDRGLKL